MPRSIQDILEHADELARRFEDYTPQPGDEVDLVAEHTLQQAVLQKINAEKAVGKAVSSARTAGLSWTSIGSVLGTSGEAARQKYGPRVG